MKSFLMVVGALVVLAPQESAATENNTQGSLWVDSSEIVSLVQEIGSQGLVGEEEYSLDQLRAPGDQAAYTLISDKIAARIEKAIYALTKMKESVFRYSVIVNQAELSKDRVAEITSISMGLAQSKYDEAMRALTYDLAQEENVALNQCVSEVCVIEVTQVIDEFIAFSKSMNQDINFRKLNADRDLFWRFEQPLLRASFSKVFHKLIKDNQDHNAYVVFAAGLVSAVSTAGLTSLDLLKVAGSAVFNPRYRRIKLTVEAASISYKDIAKARAGNFESHYRSAAEQGIQTSSLSTKNDAIPTVDKTPIVDVTPIVPGKLTDPRLRDPAVSLRNQLTSEQQQILDGQFINVIRTELLIREGSYSRNYINPSSEKIQRVLLAGGDPQFALDILIQSYRKIRESVYCDRPSYSKCDFEILSLVNILFSYGADPSFVRDSGVGALEIAIKGGWTALALKFIPAVSDLNRKFQDGTTTPIQAAIQSGETQVAVALIPIVDLSQRTSDGNSLLWLAATSEHAKMSEVVKALKERGVTY